MDVPTFRAVFPEFADTTAVPDAAIQFNLDLAANSLPQPIWGARWDAGVGFYAAHYLSLALQRSALAARAIALGLGVGSVGVASGIVTSKSVGPVSKSMDATAGQSAGGGSFNLTTYGQSYLTLLDSVAVGPMQF